MKIPFLSGEAPEGYYPVNLYFLPEKFNGRDELAGTPGLVEYWDTTKREEVRGIHKFGEYVYGVVGNTLYLCGDTISPTAASTTLDTSSGHVHMENNGTHVMIVDKSYGYIVTQSSGTPTLTKITDTDMGTPKGLTEQDTYFIITQKDSSDYTYSDTSDGTAWSVGVQVATGESDNLVACISDHRELLLFGERTTEIHYNSGDATFTFERNPSAFIEVGCGAEDSPAKIDNSVFWLADDYTVRRLDGYSPIIISPPKLNQHISGYSTKSDAIGYTFKKDGNSFYVLTFPTESVTWVYNAATQLWHQWASGESQARHRSNCYCYYKGKHLVGDYHNGRIYRLDDDTYTDNSDTIRWTRTAPQIYSPNRNRLFFHEFEIEFRAGVGILSGQGSDPQVMLDWSDDGGRTWSNEHWTGVGQLGEYKTRAKWWRLGSAYARIFRVSGTDPVERSIIGAYAKITEGLH